MDVNTTLSTEVENIYDYMNQYLMNPSIFIISIIIIIVYFAIFSSLGNNNNNLQDPYGEKYNSGTSSIMVIFIGVLILLVVINGFQYFFKVDIIASIKNIFTKEPQIDIKIDQSSLNTTQNPSSTLPLPNNLLGEIASKREEVFNIPGNHYGYDEAKSICKAYGSRLASYSELENSYNEGAEWCNYGWSDQQMALFPTQQKTFDNLQKIPEHEHDCGRPGVNGGYIANPNVKFGVNCFGYKPKITSEEEEMMQHTTPYPKTNKDILMEQQVDYWKNKISEILISPFNYKSWNKI